MKSKTNQYKLILILTCILSFPISGQIKLPKLISDGMVLQRDTKINIWGWASTNEEVMINFMESDYKTKADEKGNWSIGLPPHKAGGPYEMQIKASNSIVIKDILVGDVWVCSGQSNMELPMKRVSWNYPGEIENSENKYLRQFLVPRNYNFVEPQNDVKEGSWKSANEENTPDFSAIAYFFGKEIYKNHDVPVGLINTSLGGSRAECWLSEEELKKFPNLYNDELMYRDSSLIKIIEASDKARADAWYNLSYQKDKGYEDPKNIWYSEKLNTSDWDSMKIPGYWADYNPGFVNGVVWFRKKIEIPSEMVGKPAKIILGRIVDADSVFVNGVFVGTVSYQYPPRRYDIPVGLLKQGENTIAIRVISNSGKGGFVLDKQYEIICEGSSVSLEGEWKYKLGVEMPDLPGQTFIRWKPGGLYNSMIAPLLNYKIKGALWYQGESNAWNPDEYFGLLTSLINNWRNKWNEKDLPFLYVQLPNFMEAKEAPTESSWAKLREAQLKALAVPNTGMAVAIDIGEWNDIHPLNKKDVGARLFLAADKIAYGNKNVCYSGPIYKSMKIENDKIILSFENIGNGLMAKGNEELKCFAIAGADKIFVWAQAKIENDKIIVWSNKVLNPVAVRYAWADNPEGANLFNKDGLPASPFRTDEF
ncbi:MAG: beta galactosidase jelly roll domain-containing protein [Bacteroidetes bacterium]|nr:beta galactosidase jelly roll domain-containing protein [Bacteroidota bacterium]MBU1115214.1 beta galactosidase jelly roll domain-containing protein [Bacteroidota bacterium]MBU1797232.1 beta galactosidase jelly roll domain-containing protein [Bacteroidota bacterium]